MTIPMYYRRRKRPHRLTVVRRSVTVEAVMLSLELWLELRGVSIKVHPGLIALRYDLLALGLIEWRNGEGWTLTETGQHALRTGRYRR